MMKMNNGPIDFVIPWVDGSDPAWLSEKAKVTGTRYSDDSKARYRDWDTLRYWFRGVEKYTPWVNHIYFITWGHVPEWLNQAHPKLTIVNHKDYIPKEYLPTFSSHPIELNMHRIKGLSEHFVYFNDDMFILRPMSASDFFFNGLPCDSALMNPIATEDLKKGGKGGRIFYIPYNNIQLLNRDYDMRACTLSNFFKWYHIKYGTYLIRNILLSLWPRFIGFVDIHLPQAFLKSSFLDAWSHAGPIMDETCRHAIRDDHDVSQWYIRYRQLAQGCFHPVKPRKHAVYSLSDDRKNQVLYECIRKQQTDMVCINDGANLDFEDIKYKLQTAFQSILPEKSSFER